MVVFGPGNDSRQFRLRRTYETGNSHGQGLAAGQVAAVCVVVLGFASLVTNHKVEAAGKAGHEFIYYNNASHSQEVGYWIFCLDGQQFRSGEVTNYYIEIASDC